MVFTLNLDSDDFQHQLRLKLCELETDQYVQTSTWQDEPAIFISLTCLRPLSPFMNVSLLSLPFFTLYSAVHKRASFRKLYSTSK